MRRLLFVFSFGCFALACDEVDLMPLGNDASVDSALDASPALLPDANATVDGGTTQEAGSTPEAGTMVDVSAPDAATQTDAAVMCTTSEPGSDHWAPMPHVFGRIPMGVLQYSQGLATSDVYARSFRAGNRIRIAQSSTNHGSVWRLFGSTHDMQRDEAIAPALNGASPTGWLAAGVDQAAWFTEWVIPRDGTYYLVANVFSYVSTSGSGRSTTSGFGSTICLPPFLNSTANFRLHCVSSDCPADPVDQFFSTAGSECGIQSAPLDATAWIALAKQIHHGYWPAAFFVRTDVLGRYNTEFSAQLAAIGAEMGVTFVVDKAAVGLVSLTNGQNITAGAAQVSTTETPVARSFMLYTFRVDGRSDYQLSEFQ